MLWRFGDFTIDVDTRRLRRLGQDVHLTPKAFDLLNLLIDNPNRAMSKAELQQKIWPSTFVEETNLASLIAEIRRALSGSEWIRTVYGFGYQFVGTVSREAHPFESDSARLWLMVEGRPIPLMEGVNVLGRAPDATIQLDSPGISRYHAHIVVAQGEATLEDVGSKNGTQLNARRITMATPLADFDEIRIGAVALIFRIGSQETATVSMAPEGA
ncbi:MAG TPA: FHA domain-containing protein [Thermoanaerobaculia bacterium]|nr:FHA domain-containing protein [Thermoanaerobaculia bacterium]